MRVPVVDGPVLDLLEAGLPLILAVQSAAAVHDKGIALWVIWQDSFQGVRCDSVALGLVHARDSKDTVVIWVHKHTPAMAIWLWALGCRRPEVCV